jgi:F0F1-type ATP synthase membrane subunit b/b'
LLFLLVLRWAGGDAIGTFLRQRRADVVSALDAAAAAMAAAEQAHAETGVQLAGVERETELLRAEMRAVAERERARRREFATKSAARISADARLIAEHESRAARAAIRNETVTAAVTETVALLRRQIRDPDQQRFLADFLDHVHARS